MPYICPACDVAFGISWTPGIVTVCGPPTTLSAPSKFAYLFAPGSCSIGTAEVLHVFRVQRTETQRREAGMKISS